jgi:hypothetical protein
MSEEIDVGSAKSAADSVGLTLLLPDTAAWSWHLSDSTKCGVRQYGDTALLGNQAGGAGNQMRLSASSGADMDSLYCTDWTTWSLHVRAEGFSVYNTQPGSIFANGLVDLRNLGDQNSFRRIYAENDYGDAWHITTTSGSRFSSIGGASSTIGGVPLTIGPGQVSSVAISDSSFSQPGLKHPNILVEGGTAVMGLSFYNLYLEGNGSVDSTTAMVYIGANTGAVRVFGGMAVTGQPALAGTKSVFENHGHKLEVTSFEAVDTTLGINDVTAGAQVNVLNWSGALGSIPVYRTALPAARKP